MNATEPNVLINQQVPLKQEGFKWGSIFRPKVIFLVLAAVLIVEAFFAIRSLQKPIPPPPKPPLPITSGSLQLTSLKNQYKLGDKILVRAILDSGGNPVEGADLILRFDPKVLSLSKGDVKSGKIFPTYPLIEVEREKGMVWISGTSTENSFNGIGIMAELNFSAKSAGKTTVSLEFKKGDTRDSNMVDSKGKDILEKVQNLEVEIL